MAFYKDQENKLHEIDEQFEHLLPVGSVPITEAEATAMIAELQKQSPRDIILREIAVLEQAITVRRLREMYTPEGQAWMADTDKKIIALRAQLPKLPV